MNLFDDDNDDHHPDNDHRHHLIPTLVPYQTGQVPAQVRQAPCRP